MSIEQRKEYRKYSQDIADFNEALVNLRSQYVQMLPLNTDDAGTTSANCAFIFEWVCRAYLSRAINLAENYAKLLNAKEALASALLSRALLETISNFHFLLEKVENLLNASQFALVYFVLSRFMLGGDHKFESSHKKLKKVHVSDGIRAMDKTYEFASDSYNWLSEFCHPNSLGTCFMFSRMDRIEKSLTFLNVPSAEENLSPALEGILYLQLFCDDWQRSSKVRKSIESEWKFTEEIYEIFEQKDEAE
jgi:hypothetical protein